MTSDRYGREGNKKPAPSFTRPALLPGVIAMITLMLGINSIGQDWRYWILMVTTMFALIALVFAIRGKQWWWAVPLAAVAVVWNPAFPIEFPENYEIIVGAHLGAGLICAVAGFLIKVPFRQDNTSTKR